MQVEGKLLQEKKSSSCRLITSMIVISVLASSITAGCIGYRLGSTLPPGISTIYVPTFKNQSGEPRLEGETTQATVREFQRDGTLKVSEANLSDSTLEVTLTAHGLEPLRYEKDREKTASEYRLRIKADIIFRMTGSGRVLLKKSVEGESTFTPAGDLAAGKRLALPEAARDLAHDIVESIVEYW